MRVHELGATQGIDGIRTVERPLPVIAQNEILIRIRAVSLNHSDLSVLRGAYSRHTPRHMVLCSDGAGDVVEVGSRVTRITQGDRVAPVFMPKWIEGSLTEPMTREARGRTIDGTLAEYVAVHEDAVVTIPEHLSWEEAATLPTAGVTAWNAIVDYGKVKPGETVLVLGSGGLSLFAAQFALEHGASVIATSGSTDKFDRLKAMGIAEVIDYRTLKDWGKSVREMTRGGVDQVVEVGGAGTIEQSLRAVRVGGRISLIGALSGYGEMNPISIVMKSINVQGIYVGSRHMFESMNTFISQRQFRPHIDCVFEFDNAPEAFKYLQNGRHFGKVCIRVA